MSFEPTLFGTYQIAFCLVCTHCLRRVDFIFFLHEASQEAVCSAHQVPHCSDLCTFCAKFSGQSLAWGTAPLTLYHLIGFYPTANLLWDLLCFRFCRQPRISITFS